NLNGGNREGAIALLEKAVKLNANNAYALTILANRVDFLNPTRSLALRKQAMALDPNSIIALNNYAANLIYLGKHEEAVSLFERIKIIQPESQFGYLGLARVNVLRGQLADALVQFERAVQLSPKDGLLKFEVSKLHFSLGLTEQAKDTISDIFFAPYRHVYEENLEQHLIEAQQVFPRTEQDSYGNFLRALAEFSNANYNDSARYFKLATGYCDYCIVRLFSYIEADEAYGLEQLELKKQRFQNAVIQGEAYYLGRHNEAELLEIALLEKDADRAIQYYEQLVNKKQPIDVEILYFKPYQFLRDHPEWPRLIKRHKAIMAEEREKYLSLTAPSAVF
ncbi:MAG: tetratricopeptide repeat protein, partial [Enterobacterales bacterium]|nr:tetratricopeptide repeat protein [Enterobacterales bacterium]